MPMRGMGLILLSFIITTNAESAQAAEHMRGAAIRLDRFGGFAGISSTYWIYPDGRILGRDGNESRIEPRQVQLLLSRMQTLTFPVQRKPSLCMDCFHYRISVAHGAGIRSFTIDEDFLNTRDPDIRVVNDLLTLLPRR